MTPTLPLDMKSKHMFKWREKKKISGLCVTCGKRKAFQSRSTCGRCLANSSKNGHEYRENNKSLGKCTVCGSIDAEPGKKRCSKHLKKERERTRILKNKVYQGYDNKCACCGESERAFLSIDHVDNDGATERRLGISGCRLFRYIIANNFPSKYQILCMNCNHAKSRLGVCPHKSRSSSSMHFEIAKILSKDEIESVIGEL